MIEEQHYLETISLEVNLITLIFLGLKKQEEDKAKEHLRQAQIRKTGIDAGTSTGLMGIDTTGFVEPSLASGLSTPAEVYEDAVLRPEPTLEEMEEIRRNLRASNDLRRAEEQKALEIIRASMIGDTERYREQVGKQQFEISQMAKNDLSDVHGQVLPAGVPVHSMDAPVQSNQGYPPSLRQSPNEATASLPAPPPQAEESEEDEEILSYGQRTVMFIDDFDYNKVMENNDIKYDDLMFQLFFRDKLREEDINMVLEQSNDIQKKIYLLGRLRSLKNDNELDIQFDRIYYRNKIRNWKKYKKEFMTRSSSSSSSSAGFGSAIVGGAKAVGGAVLEVGKEAGRGSIKTGSISSSKIIFTSIKYTGNNNLLHKLSFNNIC